MNNDLKKTNEKVTIDFSIEELEERLEAVSITPLGTDPACACGGCVCVVCYCVACVCNCVTCYTGGGITPIVLGMKFCLPFALLNCHG